MFSSNTRPTAGPARRILLTCLFALVPLAAAAAPEACRDALPLPLDGPVSGYAPSREPARYAVEVARPGLLLVEAHGAGSSPDVRFLGRACRAEAGNLPLPAIRGRHVHRLDEPGTYFVEVAAPEAAASSFRLEAWLVRRATSAAGLLKDGDDDDGPREPIDEWDELRAGDVVAGTPPPTDPTDDDDDGPREPIDEWDELRAGGVGGRQEPSATWREIAGHGVLEMLLASAGREVRFHAWCPWAERPGLLSTFTCAPRLDLDETDTVELGGAGLVGLTLASAGWLVLEADDALLFDARGRLAAEPSDGEPVRLAAGSYFLRASGGGAVRVDVWIE